jgi:outer membrane protein OmpA-like peptidoglycan-associated protein
MSDDKTTLENPENSRVDSAEASPTTAPAASNITPTLALAFVIIALVAVLIVMSLKSGVGQSRSAAADLTALQAEIDARRAELNRELVARGRSPLAGDAEPLDEIANRLKKDADSLVSLTGSFQELIAKKEQELTAKSRDFLQSETARQALIAEVSQLRSDLKQALDGRGDTERLRADFVELNTQRDELFSEVGELRAQLKSAANSVPEADFADLKRRLDETIRARDFFEAKVKELQGDLSKIKLFATTENELLPAGVQLFRSLKLLEDKPDSELASSYSAYDVDLGATVLETVTFATGSAELSPETQERVRKLVEEMPDGDLLFVAGYASRTGNPENNQKLSSDRATAVVEYYASLKRPAQLAQAVYLGQTARFSSEVPERNQICEIWRIRKQP